MDGLLFEWLDREEYQGFPLIFRYTTDGYYHVQTTELGMKLRLRHFNQPVSKQFTDSLFSSWLEDPVALGVFAGEVLAGVI